jgi:hypothetical protein
MTSPQQDVWDWEKCDMARVAEIFKAGAHYFETNRTETNQQKYLPILFPELFRNRKLDADPRGIVRANSLRRIQCPKKNLRPEGHCLNI